MGKRVFVIGLIFIALLAGCSGSANSPKAAVEKFFKALENNDTKALNEAATPETVQLMAMLGTKAQGIATANGKITSLSETINGDTAVVLVTFENGEEENIDLKKVDGKWKVYISMDK
ncbi:MAG: DUF4878 domain-containing protein [Treponema sp.]|jgi:hypothetical protein|nr:DUF4878 domain-containing protein [Treponema sp.]